MTSLNRFADCKKNGTHPKFIAVKNFTKSYLPEKYQDNDMLEFAKAVADLTVKITVSFTSPNRPEFWPDSDVPYPYNNLWGSGQDRVASGWVDRVRKHSEEEQRDCPCRKCTASHAPSRAWGEVIVVTATHCVFDRFEAQNVTCRLFYDAEGVPEVSVSGTGVSFVEVEGDRCALVCATCDRDLLERLSSAIELCESLKSRLSRKYTGPDHKLAFIASHPHGCPKQFSFGEWVKMVEDSDSRRRYIYNTCTCPGSGGAPVVILSNINQPTFLPHSGSLDDSSNFCSRI